MELPGEVEDQGEETVLESNYSGYYKESLVSFNKSYADFYWRGNIC